MKFSGKRKRGKFAKKFKKAYREHPPGTTDPLKVPKKKKKEGEEGQ